MGTKLGFYIFIGLIVGAVASPYSPLAPFINALIGAVLGGLLAVILDRKQDRSE